MAYTAGVAQQGSISHIRAKMLISLVAQFGGPLKVGQYIYTVDFVITVHSKADKESKTYLTCTYLDRYFMENNGCQHFTWWMIMILNCQ